MTLSHPAITSLFSSPAASMQPDASPASLTAVSTDGTTPARSEGEQDTPTSWLASLQAGNNVREQPGALGTQLAHDAYDLAAWNLTRRHSERLQQALKTASARCASAPALLQDLFLSFYKAAPTFSPEASSPLDRIHRTLLSEVFQTREWQELRATGATGDPVMSAMGAIALTERILASLDEETRARLNTLAEAEQELQQMLQQAQTLQEAACEVDLTRAEQLAALAEQRQREALAQAQQYAPLLSSLEQQVQQQAGAVRHATRQALRETIQTTAGFQQALTAFGNLTATGPLAASQIPLKTKLDLAGRMQRSSRLQEIALLCGQMQAFAHALQQAKLEETPEELDGVTLGRELSQVLPGELALWDDPETELLFLKGFAEGRLWQYKRHAQRLEGQGPILVALDSSGSMAGELDGQAKEVWSKAVALSLLSIARLQQRDIAILHFSNGVTTYQYARGQATLEELTDCAEAFEGGGTNFEAWMREALRLVDTATYDRADVICISDGLADVSDQMERAWNRRRRERGMRVFGILLADEDEAGAEVFARIADVSFSLSSLSDHAALTEVFTI